MARLTKQEAEARRRRVLELRPIFNELLPEYQTTRGADNIGIAKALNERGMPNLSGSEWTKTDVSNFTARDLVDKGAVAQPESTPDRKDEIQKEQDARSTIDELETSGKIEEPYSPFSEIPPITARVEIVGPEDSDTPAVDRPETPLPEPPENDMPDTSNMPTIGQERAALPDDLAEILTTAHVRGDIEALLTWWRTGKGGTMAATKRPRFTGDRVNTGLLVNRRLKDRAFARAKQEGMSLSQLTEWLFWRYLGEPGDCIEE